MSEELFEWKDAEPIANEVIEDSVNSLANSTAVKSRRVGVEKSPEEIAEDAWLARLKRHSGDPEGVSAPDGWIQGF